MRKSSGLSPFAKEASPRLLLERVPRWQAGRGLRRRRGLLAGRVIDPWAGPGLSLLLLRLHLLLPGLEDLLLLVGIIGVANRTMESTLLFGLGLERLPDHG